MGEIVDLKKAFFALSLVRSLENFKQEDEDNVTLILFVYVRMRENCIPLHYTLRREIIVHSVILARYFQTPESDETEQVSRFFVFNLKDDANFLGAWRKAFIK